MLHSVQQGDEDTSTGSADRVAQSDCAAVDVQLVLIEAQSLAERDIPDYVVADGTDKVTFNRVPSLDEVPYPVTMEPNLVVEFYSR